INRISFYYFITNNLQIWGRNKNFIYFYIAGWSMFYMRGVATRRDHLRITCKYGAGTKTSYTFISRGGAVWKLVWLITQRSQVQILPPQPIYYQVHIFML